MTVLNSAELMRTVAFAHEEVIVRRVKVESARHADPMLRKQAQEGLEKALENREKWLDALRWHDLEMDHAEVDCLVCQIHRLTSQEVTGSGEEV